MLTEHNTLVLPSSIKAEPSAKLWYPKTIRTGRSSLSARLSNLAMPKEVYQTISQSGIYFGRRFTTAFSSDTSE
jgi:hypothetical protein